MELKDAFKELVRFAEARARGATVVLVGGLTFDGSDGFTGCGMDADYLMAHPIKEIIEPKVFRDWTAEDAKKHVGYAYRLQSGAVTLIGFTTDGTPAKDNGYWSNWPGEYAAPIPGTDPAKWDWKPCKVEVPTEPAKPPLSLAAAAMLQLANMSHGIDREPGLCPVARGFYKNEIAEIMKVLGGIS